ncbi:hypothetical protein NEPAR06_1045 [Nematocida parisii]|nr:hypothetical protein NEPAR06_1045 [Nematocida parisii]
MYFIRHILVLFYIICIKARMVWEDIEQLKGITIGKYNGNEMMLAQGSSLYLMTLYIIAKKGLIYNLSMFSYEIDRKFELKIKYNASGANDYEYSKTSYKSGIFIYNKLQPSMPNMRINFYKCLIGMIPIIDEAPTIYTKEKDSFFTFLNNIQARKDRLKLLASLFLLSQGINISLEIKTNKYKEDVLVLKTSENSTKNYFVTELRLGNIIYENKMNESETASSDNNYYHSHTRNIVDFYKKIKDAILLPLPSQYTDVTIDMAKTLIQTYIFEYIPSKEDMKEYLVETFNILKEHVEVIEKEDSNNAKRFAISIFNNIFCPINEELLDIETENIEKLKKIFDCVSNCLFIPFHRELCVPAVLQNFYQIPSSTSLGSGSVNQANLPKHHTYASIGDPSELERFTIGTQTSILTLLCCCFYNSTDMEYTLKTVEDPPTELKWFFTKYRDLFDTEDLSVHCDWYCIINGLTIKTPPTAEIKDQYYTGGLLSMLSIILCITNGSEDAKKELNELIKNVRKAEVHTRELTININNVVNKILALLSFNKKMEVLPNNSDLKIARSSTVQSDVFGKLCLKIFNNSNVARILTIYLGYSEITAMYDDIQKSESEEEEDSGIKHFIKSKINDILSIQDSFSFSNADTSEIIKEYIQIITNNTIQITLDKNIKPCFVQYLDHVQPYDCMINQIELFSWGKIKYTSDKRMLIESFLLIDYSAHMLKCVFSRGIIINVIGSMINFNESVIDKVIRVIDRDWSINCFNDNITMDEKVYSNLKPSTRVIKVEQKSEVEDQLDNGVVCIIS